MDEKTSYFPPADFDNVARPKISSWARAHGLTPFELLVHAEDSGLTDRQKSDLRQATLGKTSQEIADASPTHRKQQAVTLSINCGIRKAVKGANRNRALGRRG